MGKGTQDEMKQVDTREDLKFSKDEDQLLANYLARKNPSPESLLESAIYKSFVTDEKLVIYTISHPWKAWRQRYIDRREDFFDPEIKKILESKTEKAQPPKHEPSQSQSCRKRVKFTSEDRQHLTEYLADNSEYGRTGNKAYMKLVEKKNEWPWVRRHTWQSWRENYRKHPDEYDRRIKKLKMKKRKQVPAEPDVSDQDMGGRGRTGEFSAPAAKRRRLELHQESNRKQTSSRIVDLRQEEKEGFQDTSNSATGLGDTQTFRSPEHTERQGGANSQGERDQVDEAPNNIPGSDDYNGEIFDRKDNDDEGSDEGDANEVEYVVDGSPRDSSHELPEIPQKEDQPHEPSPVFRTAGVTSTSAHQYPSTPSPPTKVQQDHHPFSQPTPTRGPMPIIVQRTPPIPPKISQGPTPPTSAHSPDPDHHRTSPVLELNDILPQLSVMKGDSSVDPRVKLLARRKPVRKQIESDFYASSPPVASSSKSPAFPRKREPPVLHQGPFNSVFTTPSGRWTQRSSRRRVSGVMEEEEGEEEGEPAIQDRVENWPPKRHQGKGKGRAIEPPLDVTSHSEVPRSQHHPFSQPLQPPNHAMGADIGDEDHHPFSRPSLSPNHTLDIGVDDDHYPFSQESEPESPQPEEKQPPGPELEVVMSKNDLDMLENALELLTRPPASHTSPQPEQHPAEDPSLPNPLVSKSHDSGSAQHHIARLPEPFKPRNDSGAFLHYQPTPWYQDKERASTPIVLAPHLNRRHTFGGTAPVEKDLQPHEFLRQRFLAQQSSSPSTRLSQSPKPPEPAPQFRGIRLRPEDLERVIQTGMDSTLRLMAENHGQHLEAAKVMWERTGDLVLTDLGLRKMREAAQDAGEDYINSLQESVLEPEKQNDVPVPTPSRDVFNDQGSRRKSRSTLQFTPLDLEDEYEPLAGTRAAIVAHRMGNQKSYVSYSAGRSSSSNKSSQAVEGILDGDFGKGIQAESSFRVE